MIILRKKVKYFNIINYECRGESLKESLKDHKTITKNDFKRYPEADENKFVSAAFRNVDRDDLQIKRDLMTKHFNKNF